MRNFIKRLYLCLRSAFLNLSGIWVRQTLPPELAVQQIRKILLIKLERIGDLVLATPVLRELRRRFLNQQIVVLVNEYTRDIIIAEHNIDKVLTCGSAERGFFGMIKFIRKIKGMHFDLVVDLTCNNENVFRPVFFSYFSGARYRLGFNQFGRGFLFNIRVPYRDEYRPLSELMFDIVRPLGIDCHNLAPQINVSAAGREFAQGYLDKLAVRQEDRLIGIHPGGYYPAQRWGAEGFARVADELIVDCGARVIIVTGPREEQIASRISRLMKNRPSGVLTDITLAQLVGLISRLDLLICNNSAALQIAVGLGVATVSTMGPTIPRRWWPRGESHTVIRKELDCSPCSLGRCRKHDCMKLISAEEMLQAAKNQLKKLNRRKTQGLIR